MMKRNEKTLQFSERLVNYVNGTEISFGNEINDETLLQDIAHGANVISYREEKLGEERHIVQR